MGQELQELAQWVLEDKENRHPRVMASDDMAVRTSPRTFTSTIGKLRQKGLNIGTRKVVPLAQLGQRVENDSP